MGIGQEKIRIRIRTDAASTQKIVLRKNENFDKSTLKQTKN